MTISGISYAKAADAIKDGALILGAFALPVNALNGVSVVCCKNNCSTLDAISTIYQGRLSHSPPSALHFTNGMGPYAKKEGARLLCKVGGLTFLKPWLEQTFRSDPYGALKTSFCFSATLAAWEMAIQPFDAKCTQAQTGKGKGSLNLKHAYVGATANGVRQFKTWMMFSYIETISNRILSQNTNIAPHSSYGILAKSLPVGFAVTLTCHPEQRLKNHLQIFQTIAAEAAKNKKSRYAAAWNHMIQTQGYSGLMRGLFPKGLSNSILAGGAMLLLEKGREASTIKK